MKKQKENHLKLKIDLHTHPLGDTDYYKFSAKPSLTKQDEQQIIHFLKEMARRNIHAIAATDHDRVESGWFAQKVVKELNLPLLVVPGVEVTALFHAKTGPQRIHILALGLKENIPGNKLSVLQVIREIRRQGATPIIAHPARYSKEFTNTLWDEYLYKLDGLEIRNFHNGSYPIKRWLEECSKWDGRFLLQTIGTDAHYTYDLHRYNEFYTETPVNWLIEKDLCLPKEIERALSWKKVDLVAPETGNYFYFGNATGTYKRKKKGKKQYEPSVDDSQWDQIPWSEFEFVEKEYIGRKTRTTGCLQMAFEFLT